MKTLVIEREALRHNIGVIKERAGQAVVYAGLTGDGPGAGLGGRGRGRRAGGAGRGGGGGAAGPAGPAWGARARAAWTWRTR